MHYRLRTLHLLLGLLPPILAACWWIVEYDPAGTMAAFAFAILFGLAALLFLIFVAKILEIASKRDS